MSDSALKSLSAAWRTAPTCVREAFRSNLVRDLSWMTEDLCFCADDTKRKDVEHHLAANARVLSEMPGIGAPFARKLRKIASQPDAHFDCRGPG